MNGWISCLMYFLIIGVVNILVKFVANDGYHSIAFMSHAILAAGLIMLIIAPPGKLTLETINHPKTWTYGLFYMAYNACAIVMLKYIDVSVLMTLSRVSTIIGFILVWIFLARRNNFWINLGLQGLIALGVYLSLSEVPSEFLAVVSAGAIFMGLMQALRALTVELHTPNNKARTFEDELRVTGFVLAVTGVTFYFIILSLIFFNQYLTNTEGTLLIPSFEQFFNLNGLTYATMYGLFATSSIRYFEFYTVKRIKSENFLAAMAFLPLIGLFFESIAAWVGIVPMRGITTMQYLAMSIIVAASFLIIIFGRKQSPIGSNNLVTTRQAKRDQVVAANALQHTQGDTKAAAKLLGLPAEAFSIALGQKAGERLPIEISKRMHDQFINNIATRDGLTGLINRNHFMAMLEQALRQNNDLTIVYLDLNGFKPINDQYGHAAGDQALQITAQRLERALKNDIAARMGGDEFACILMGIKGPAAQKIVNRLKATLSDPFKVEDVAETLTLGASFGIATAPEDGLTPELLLKTADEHMYKEKKQ